MKNNFFYLTNHQDSSNTKKNFSWQLPEKYSDSVIWSEIKKFREEDTKKMLEKRGKRNTKKMLEKKKRKY